MDSNIFEGELVRLVMLDYKEIGKVFARHQRDSEYMRLLDSCPMPAWSEKKISGWFEKMNEEDSKAGNNFFFIIQDKASGKAIGDIGLDGVMWNHGDCFVGIGIGERELWGKGYGSDAMRIILRYAFIELGLQRVSLDVFEYNPRAIRSYEKCGFRHEGRVRGYLHRDGRRWDLVFMGILREEWFARYGSNIT